MKSMQPPLAAIFFMTYFHRVRGGMAPSAPLDLLLLISENSVTTRMHSSTGRTLTIFQCLETPRKNWRPPRKIGDPLKNWRHPEKLETPPVNRMTDACENITLAKTSFRPVKICVIKRARTSHLLCKRPRCYHSTSKTHVRDRVFYLSPFHASVIYQIT